MYSYVHNNPITLVDPYGLDYWIEGPSGSEPAGHQSLAIGDPMGKYTAYSFGVNGEFNLYHYMEGTVYEDTKLGGKIISDYYRKTTTEEDLALQQALAHQVGIKNMYIFWRTCRNFSQSRFKMFDKLGFGLKTTPPKRKNSNTPSSSVGISSSSVLLSEPYGPISSSSDRLSSSSSSKSSCKK